MTGIVILTVIAALLTAVFTLIWWKAGDQWASEEYKKFGRSSAAVGGPEPEVIRDFNSLTGTEHSDAPTPSQNQTQPIKHTPKQADQ